MTNEYRVEYGGAVYIEAESEEEARAEFYRMHQRSQSDVVGVELFEEDVEGE